MQSKLNGRAVVTKVAVLPLGENSITTPQVVGSIPTDCVRGKPSGGNIELPTIRPLRWSFCFVPQRSIGISKRGNSSHRSVLSRSPLNQSAPILVAYRPHNFHTIALKCRSCFQARQYRAFAPDAPLFLYHKDF